MMNMQKTQFIRDISANDEVHSVFALSQATQGQARNGLFWRLVLADASGTVGAKVWSPLSQQFTALAPGMMVAVRGRAATFRDQLDVNVDALHILGEEELAGLDMADFMPASERHPDDMMEDLLQLCRTTFTHKPWMRFIKAVFRDEEIGLRFKTAVGAKHLHHAFAGGLLEHTLSVSQLCMRLCDHYPELDRQVLLAGAIFHDMGKAWELSGGIANDYTDEGRLIGHISIGLEKAEPYLVKSGLDPALVMHFKHLVLGHHGTKEWGSPVLPATPEAMVLHYADNIDAKLAQTRSLFADLGEVDTGWTPFQPTLGRQMYKPARTPEPEASENAKRETVRDTHKDDQCSLL